MVEQTLPKVRHIAVGKTRADRDLHIEGRITRLSEKIEPLGDGRAARRQRPAHIVSVSLHSDAEPAAVAEPAQALDVIDHQGRAGLHTSSRGG